MCVDLTQDVDDMEQLLAAKRGPSKEAIEKMSDYSTLAACSLSHAADSLDAQ